MPLNDGFLAQISEATTANAWTERGRLSRSSGSFGQVQRVEYNGYVFPPALNSSATIEPLYSETGRHRTGTKIGIEVSCILVDQTATNAERSNPAFQIPSTDANLLSLRSLLNQNGQKLSFELQGLGVINVSGNTAQYNTSTGSNYTVIDLDKGPKTQLVEWNPITPLAAKVTWRVETTIPDCATSGSAVPFYRDFFGTVSTQVDHLGYMDRTISGSLKVPTPSTVTGVPTAAEADAAQDILEKQFPRLVHFEREYQTTLSADGGTLEFTITDTEIRTDTPYFPGTSKPDVTMHVSSGLGENEGGFGMWTVSLDGTIPVMNGVSKVYGFLAALTLIDYFLQKGFEGDIPGGVDQTNYNGTDKSYAILTDLSFSDQVYGKNVSFSAGWKLATSLDTLLQATGMFVPAGITYDKITYNDGNVEDASYDEDTPLTFGRWKNSAGRQVNRTGIHNFVYTGTDFPQVVLCSPQLVTQKPNPTEVYQSGPSSSSITQSKPAVPTPDKSWLHVEYEVSIIESNQVFSAGVLTDQPVTQITTGAGNDATLRMLQDPENPIGTSASQFKPLPPNDETSGTSSIQSQYLRKAGKNKFFVEVKGVLVRAFYEPVVPYIGKIGGLPAYKIGKGVSKEIPWGKGTTTTNTSKPFAIRAVAFRQLYAMLDAPQNFDLADKNGNTIFNSQVDQ